MRLLVAGLAYLISGGVVSGPRKGGCDVYMAGAVKVKVGGGVSGSGI